jgi:hypothetical protein
LHKKGEKMKSKFGIILLAILAVSSLSFAAGAYALPFMSYNTVPNPTVNVAGLQRNSVRMYGSITEWQTTPTPTAVSGVIEVLSRTSMGPKNTVQGFAATAMWTTNTTRPIAAVRSRENFTYSFYAARLVSGNFSALDYNGNAFFMNGTWNVWSITETFVIKTNSTTGRIVAVNSNLNAVALASDAYGTVTVPSGWSSFTLAIAGVAPLTGKVVAEVTTSAVFNPFMLGTDSSTSTVTQSDLNSIVNAYGSMPGWGNYNINMDYCMHYQIDICDLATAAANLNAS